MTSERGAAPRPYRTRLSGREPITHPLAPVLIDLGRRLAERGLEERGGGAIALRAGKSLLVTAQDSVLGRLTTGDLVEVADYDPLERLLLAVGPREPADAAPLLWLVVRHRDEVGAAIFLPGALAGTAAAAADVLAVAARVDGDDPLEHAKGILKALRDAPVVRGGGGDVLATGPSVPTAEHHLMRALARADPARFGGDAWAGPDDARPTKRRNGGPRRHE